MDNIYKLYFASNSTTFICSGGAAGDNGLVVYSSQASGGYNTNLAITYSGNATIRGQISNGSNSYLYAGGLRIGGFDTGNTK
jgi:hypothetical protein